MLWQQQEAKELPVIYIEEYSMHFFYEVNPSYTGNGAIIFIKSFYMIIPTYIPYRILEITVPIHDQGKQKLVKEYSQVMSFTLKLYRNIFSDEMMTMSC